MFAPLETAHNSLVQKSREFSGFHLVLDQGVGGSNPLSPTNLFKHINSISGFSVTSL